MISGLVPRIVITLSLGTVHLGAMRVGPLRVEDFRGPEQDDHLRRSDVLDTVSHAGRDIDDGEVPAGYGVLGHGRTEDGSKPDDGVTFEDTELLHFEIVIVIAARDPWM